MKKEPGISSIARRAKRQNWPVVKTTLNEQDRLPAQALTGQQSLAMMWQLALDAWASTGRPLPNYTRAHTPVRRLVRGEPGTRWKQD